MENILALDLMKNLTANEIARLYQLGYRIEGLVDPVVNFGKVTVSTGYNNSVMSIVLNTNDGIKLPYPATDGAFNLVWYNSSDYSDPSDDPFTEIVRCTSRSGDTLTISRGEEGTAASNKNLLGKTYKMILSPTKKTITDIQIDAQSKVNTHSALSTGVHGVGIDIVDGITARNTAISSHSTLISSVHNFDVSGNAPPQVHGLVSHTGIIGDHIANLSSVGTNTHAQIDSHISANTGIHGAGINFLALASGSQYIAVNKVGDTMTGVLNLPSNGLIVGTNQLIVSGGNVGIGKSSPWTTLDINGHMAIAANGRFYTRSGDPSSGYFYGTGSWIERHIGYANDLDHWGWFKSNDTTPLFFINGNNGYIGIGTTGPTAKLHIGGTPGVDGIKFPDGTTQTTASSVTNLARTIMPTTTGWTTIPTTLSNITDENEATTTGVGVCNDTVTGTINIDLGAVYYVAAAVKAGIKNNAGAGVVNMVEGGLLSSQDGSTYTDQFGRSSSIVSYQGVPTAEILVGYGYVGYARYLRLLVKASTAGGGTLGVRIFEIRAMKLT